MPGSPTPYVPFFMGKFFTRTEPDNLKLFPNVDPRDHFFKRKFVIFHSINDFQGIC